MTENNKWFWLEQFDCFAISGKDAKKFLNGITTGNILNSDNKVSKTCWLTPNGILRSLLEIIFLENKLKVVILEGDKKEILDYFHKIIFPSDDVSLSKPFSIYRFQEIDNINSWRIYKPVFFTNDDPEYEIYKNRKNILNPFDLKIWKLNQAIPSLANEINGKNNPLELGLGDLIDFKKGCFLGQETMSKIRNGPPLKQEIRVWNSSNCFLNHDSENKFLYTNSKKEHTIGKVTSYLKLDSKVKGLAIIKRKYLGIEKFIYSEIFGNIKIQKSVGSTFI